MSSVINTTIKPFKTTAYHNGKFVPVSEADLKGKWSIFFFYPADFTFVCPTELGDVADIYQEFKKIGVEVYSVSTDTHFTHKAWHDASDTIKKIQYPMLGDPTHAISRNFGVLIEVADGDKNHPSELAQSDRTWGGRGVQAVVELASSWGVRVEGAGKVVWAMLPIVEPTLTPRSG